jgi:hypothetical protein
MTIVFELSYCNVYGTGYQLRYVYRNIDPGIAVEYITSTSNFLSNLRLSRFQVKGKLAPRYIGPFKILGRRGEVSYQLEMPPELFEVHDVFHMSLLWKCLEVPEKQEVFKNIDHRSVDINKDLTYREVPVRILEEAYRTTRTRSIKFLKVQWSNHTEDEATWEREDYLQKEFPNLFSS